MTQALHKKKALFHHMNHKISNLWANLSESLFSQIDDKFIDNFRQPGGVNSRLAAWDPFDPTMRYYKLILFNAAMRWTDDAYLLYRKLGNTNVGNPVTVRSKGLDINLDYLFTINEYMFLKSNMNIQSINSIIEIGAGFGRTCHALLKLLPNLTSYTIIDLPELLNLRAGVLARVVPDHMQKISFINATVETDWQNISADLVINIDSFQEMLPETIKQYFDNVINRSSNFYINNPIGKYLPESVGITNPNKIDIMDVFQLGYCRNVIDIFDETQLNRARDNFVQSYMPGSEWQAVAQSPMEIVPYYHNVLYTRKS